MQEAASLRHEYIGTEHLVLALAEHRESTAGQALSALGVTKPDVYQGVLTWLAVHSRESTVAADRSTGLLPVDLLQETIDELAKRGENEAVRVLNEVLARWKSGQE
jgi:ATP-dependent Clp protease ATP-binding subunit ClpA